jgi:hypothetical protein
MVSCSSGNREANANSIALLGVEKYNAYELLLTSFDSFIDVNYKKGEAVKDNYIHFLNDVDVFLSKSRGDEKIDPKVHWKIDVSTVLKTVLKMEQSKMRHEIWLYPHEEYLVEKDINGLLSGEKELAPFVYSMGGPPLGFMDSIPTKKELMVRARMDSSLFDNPYGLFLYSLLTLNPQDTLTRQYVEIKVEQGNISPSVITEGFRNMLDKGNENQLSTMRHLIAIELYYPIMREMAKQEKGKTTR